MLYSKNKKIKLLEGFWEDIMPQLPDESFDGILFDIYPLDLEQSYVNKDHAWFFGDAYRLLKKKGVFTYYSNEYKKNSKKYITTLKRIGF